MLDVTEELAHAGQRRSPDELPLVVGLRAAESHRQQEQLGPASIELGPRATRRVGTLWMEGYAHGEAPLRRRRNQEEREGVQDSSLDAALELLEPQLGIRVLERAGLPEFREPPARA